MSYYSQEDYEDMELVMESDEAVRRRRRPPPSYNANRRPYAPAPVRPGLAQSGQVSQGFERVGNDVRQMVTQIKELETRFDASDARTAKSLKLLQADLQQTKMISALLPMLSRPETVTVTGEQVTGIDSLKKGDKIAKAKDDTMSMILPLMMMTGMGGSSESGEGGNNNMMMMMVLAIALSQRPQS